MDGPSDLYSIKLRKGSNEMNGTQIGNEITARASYAQLNPKSSAPKQNQKDYLLSGCLDLYVTVLTVK